MNSIKEYYNAKKIIKVSIFDIEQSDWYFYHKEIKIFGLLLQKNGVYNRLRNYISKEPESHLIIINGIIYEKPKVRIYFQDGFVKVLYFENLESLNKYIEAQKLVWGIREINNSYLIN